MSYSKSVVCAIVSFIVSIPVAYFIVNSAREGNTENISLYSGLLLFAVVLSFLGLLFYFTDKSAKKSAPKVLGLIWNGFISLCVIAGIFIKF